MKTIVILLSVFLSRYEVIAKSKKSSVDDIKEMLLSRFSNQWGAVQCGIIYCLSRNDCERVAEEINGMRQKNGKPLTAR